MSSNRYTVPRARIRVEDRIQNSRFIATMGPAPSVEEAKAFIDSVRAEYPDATHNCYAFVVGPPGSSLSAGASDDGEPGGTAGRPMLSILMSAGVGDVVAVVTRYFGGIKLGKGGLVRAYSGAVQHALRELPLGERVELVSLRIVVPYAQGDAVRRAIGREGGTVVEQHYGEDVSFRVDAPDDRVDAIERAIMDATAGSARIDR